MPILVEPVYEAERRNLYDRPDINAPGLITRGKELMPEEFSEAEIGVLETA